MKINGYSKSVPSTNETKSVMFSTNQGTGGTTYAKGFTQNRNSPSVSFRSCDNFFVFLDSLYAAFPAGPSTNPTTKAAWQQASDQSAGWQVLGCSDSEPDGQTYHRCYNFYAAFMGQPITNVAPNPTAFYGYFIDQIQLDLTTNPSVPMLKVYHTFPPPATLRIILNCNLCFDNYETLLTGPSPDISFPTPQEVAQITAAVRGDTIGFGSFGDNVFFPQTADRTGFTII